MKREQTRRSVLAGVAATLGGCAAPKRSQQDSSETEEVKPQEETDRLPLLEEKEVGDSSTLVLGLDERVESEQELEDLGVKLEGEYQKLGRLEGGNRVAAVIDDEEYSVKVNSSSEDVETGTYKAIRGEDSVNFMSLDQGLPEELRLSEGDILDFEFQRTTEERERFSIFTDDSGTVKINNNEYSLEVANIGRDDKAAIRFGDELKQVQSGEDLGNGLYVTDVYRTGSDGEGAVEISAVTGKRSELVEADQQVEEIGDDYVKLDGRFDVELGYTGDRTPYLGNSKTGRYNLHGIEDDEVILTEQEGEIDGILNEGESYEDDFWLEEVSGDRAEIGLVAGSRQEYGEGDLIMRDRVAEKAYHVEGINPEGFIEISVEEYSS